MSVPGVTVGLNQFATGSTSPSPTGVMAIVAASAGGAPDVAGSYSRDDLVASDYVGGPLVEFCSYTIQEGGNPVVAVKSAASIAGAYGVLTSTALGGTSVVTEDAVVVPIDDFNFLLTVVTGGTIGVAGIVLSASFDGGNTTIGGIALGTATSLQFNLPNGVPSGVKLDFAAGTLVAGATFQVYTSRPQPNNADLTAALEALRVSRIPYEGILIDCAYNTGTVGVIDTWLAGQEAVGQFHFAVINTRHKLQPAPTAESETTFAAAMSALVATDASPRVVVGTDAGDLTSTLTGVSQPRPVSLAVIARAAAIDVGEDPAYVGRGNIGGFTITDAKSNPKWHDEDLYPNLDSQRLTTFRGFSNPGPQGVYLTDANMLSAAGSDFVWLQHLRTINLARSISWKVLTGQLSLGVELQAPNPDKTVYIAEHEAQKIEGLVNSALAGPLKGQVTSITFELSRTDNLAQNNASTVTGYIVERGLRYLKKYKITAAFAP